MYKWLYVGPPRTFVFVSTDSFFSASLSLFCSFGLGNNNNNTELLIAVPHRFSLLKSQVLFSLYRR